MAWKLLARALSAIRDHKSWSSARVCRATAASWGGLSGTRTQADITRFVFDSGRREIMRYGRDDLGRRTYGDPGTTGKDFPRIMSLNYF